MKLMCMMIREPPSPLDFFYLLLGGGGQTEVHAGL